MESSEVLLLAGSFALGSAITAGILLSKMKSKCSALEKKYFDESGKVISDLKSTHSKEREQVATEHQQTMSEAQQAITSLSADLSAKDSELNLLTSCEFEFAQFDTSNELYNCLLEVIKRSFAPEASFAVVYKLGEPIEMAASNAPGPPINPACFSNHREEGEPGLFEGKSTTILRSDEVPQLSNSYPEIECITILPISNRDRELAAVCVFWSTDQYHTKLRLLKKVIDFFSRALYRVVRFEEEITISRVDSLTGLPNSQYLHEMFPHIMGACDVERPLSVVMLECNNLSEINEKYGRAIADQLIKELAMLMKTSARLEELVSDKRTPDHFIRYSGVHFLILLEDTTATEAMTVAERIRVAVEEKTDWPGGVPNWNVSIGVVSCNDQSTESSMLLLQAEVALQYVKEHLHGNQSILFDHVPRTYRVSKLSAKVAGSLDIFDPATVLQSIAKSARTGILAVDEPDGRQFWGFYEDGRIKKARLIPFRGETALIEFLSTFEDGAFGFQEYTSLDGAALEELHSLDASYDVLGNLDENLIDGAVAQDKLANAKRAIPNTRLFARMSQNASQLIGKLPRISDPPPSRMELETMAYICKQVNGRTMLVQIMDKMETVPTYLRWHASAVLVNSKVVELSKLAISFSL